MPPPPITDCSKKPMSNRIKEQNRKITPKYGTPNTSEVTGSFVDNQKFALTIRNLC